jgi:hypothetical protein
MQAHSSGRCLQTTSSRLIRQLWPRGSVRKGKGAADVLQVNVRPRADTRVSGQIKYSLQATMARLTPDGAWVIYRRESRSGQRLMRVAITGGASQEIAAGTLIDGGVRCTILPASVCAIAERSADRRHLVFTSIDIDKGRGRELARVDAATHTEYRWALSPDGTRIAILDATQARIHVVSLTGMPSQDLEIAGLNTPGYLSWTHDGQGLS